MERKLPIVDILGTEYEVQLRQNKLVALDAPTSVKDIDLNSFRWEPDMWLSVYYDKIGRNVVQVPEEPTEKLPGIDLVAVVIPPAIQLDPIAYGEINGLDPVELAHVQLTDRHIAEIIPYEETTFYYKLMEAEGSRTTMETKANLTEQPIGKNEAFPTDRKLPGLMFGGTSFFVDVLAEEFREMQNPKNVIPFEMMVRDGDGYLVIYDPLVKNIPGPDRYQHPDIMTVEVPPLGMMDLEGMAIKYNRNIEEIRGKSDFEIIVDQSVLQQRLAGVLPEIDIQGQVFFVDLRLGELRAKDDFALKPIHLSQMEQYPLLNPVSYRFFYHTELKMPITFDTYDVTEIPKNIVAVEIPNSERLDPVRLAKLYDLDMRDFLMKYPPQARYESKVVPWEQTAVPRIIEENCQRIAREKVLESHRSTVGARKKKGRSL